MDKAEFDRFADEYQALHRANLAITGESPEFFAAYKITELARFAADLPTAPKRILDFGSGIGNSIPYFREHFPGAVLTCADASLRSIDLSRGRFPGPEHYSLIEGREIPHESDTFDVTFSACVFHHIPHREHNQWLKELLRVTRPGGMLALFEHNPLNPLTVHAVKTCPFDENAKLVPTRALLRSVEVAGWVRSRVCYHIFFPRALALLRPIEKHLRWLALGAQYSMRARKP
jgi:SAM-dependent methyltransferase